MMQTSDGKIFVYAVFDDDGYECSDFIGAFETEEEAQAVRDRIEADHLEFYKSHMSKEFAWSGCVGVKCIELGRFSLPADSLAVMEK